MSRACLKLSLLEILFYLGIGMYVEKEMHSVVFINENYLQICVFLVNFKSNFWLTFCKRFDVHCNGVFCTSFGVPPQVCVLRASPF